MELSGQIHDPVAALREEKPNLIQQEVGLAPEPV
jgi:hypothetical protein